MDPRLSHELVSQLVDAYKPSSPKPVLRTRPGGRPYDARKRYGICIELVPRPIAMVAVDADADEDSYLSFDEDSTWEFSAPAPPIARNSSTDSCSSTTTSAAQDIAIRYRAGMPLEKVLSTNDEKNPPTSTIAGSPLRSKFVDENSSRANELSEARQEAWESMRRDGRNETDTIICSRPGCGDHLRNVEALMYHLHIHNLDKENFQCRSCKQQFTYSFQLSLHRCRSKVQDSRRPLGSPLKEGFFRVLNKMTICLN